MGEDDLIKRYEDKIERPLIENKIAFLKYGINGDFEKIRGIIGFEKPEKAEKEKINALISICDNRIDRLKSFSRDLVTFVGWTLATFTLSMTLLSAKIIPDGDSILPGIAWFFGSLNYLLWKILMVILLILGILFFLSLFRYKAQANAWYAIKEGLLPFKSY
jgi:hypothetical protein